MITLIGFIFIGLLIATAIFVKHEKRKEERRAQQILKSYAIKDELKKKASAPQINRIKPKQAN